MTRLRIRHETVYTYSAPVSFGPWRLMMRPLDSHSMRVIEASLAFSPQGATHWSHDALGNSVCTLQPTGSATELSVTSTLLIERFPAPLWVRDDPRSAFPVLYATNDRANLGPFIRPETTSDTPEFIDWLRAHTPNANDLALPFLQTLNEAIHRDFSYGERHAEGTQTPSDTVALRTGTCRDFAWLMVESLRRLGFAARFVSGYLYSPAATMRGAGATHAWCEVFLPDLGWIEFDPTNGLAESPDLIRVAASRTPDEASPMSGSIIGFADATMRVSVEVMPACAPNGEPIEEFTC